MRVEHAEISLLGGREDNQDRCAVAASGQAALLVVVDGMGGHSDGALAAETAQRLFLEAFAATPQPLFDPLGFLHLTLGRVHDAVVRLGGALALEQRPRATCAVCLVQGDSAYWAHIGDSRIYLLRRGRIAERTRDHSHVEFLIREGLITESQAHAHPMRNFVECCLGGEPLLPEMTITGRRKLEPNDLLLACSDGLWAPIDDDDIAQAWSRPDEPLGDALGALARQAVHAGGATADNTSAVVLRWRGTA